MSKETDAKEIILMWKNDEYDNFKDVIEDCRDMLKVLPKKSDLREKIVKVLTEATTQFKKLMDEDPSSWANEKYLIDKKYLEK